MQGTAGAFHQSADRGLLQPDNQGSFPVPGNGPIGGLGRAFGDLHVVGDDAQNPDVRLDSLSSSCPDPLQYPEKLSIRKLVFPRALTPVLGHGVGLACVSEASSGESFVGGR